MTKNALRQKERRRRERVDFLRPIVYAYHNSDKFIEATMLNHCVSGICFQSTPPVTPGASIYIMTEDAALEPLSFKGMEAVFAKVMWCEKRSGAHWVGVQYMNNAIEYDSDEWETSAFASFETLPSGE